MLKHEGKIVYVGQSVDIERRIMQHKNDGDKVFDSHISKEFDADALNGKEAYYIGKHRPKYNVTLNPDLMIEAIESKRTKTNVYDYGVMLEVMNQHLTKAESAKMLDISRPTFNVWLVKYYRDTDLIKKYGNKQ